MSKAKALNGLPNTLVQMYFSTHAYHGNGYMPDHLWDVAARTGIREARLDVLNGTVEPAAFSNAAIASYLPRLKGQVLKELAQLGFPEDHITSAHIDVFISKKHEALRLLTGTGVITTREGRIIQGKTYTETAYPMRGTTTSRNSDGDHPWWKFW